MEYIRNKSLTSEEYQEREKRRKEYVLKFCEKCNQMKNHYRGTCQKCDYPKYI